MQILEIPEIPNDPQQLRQIIAEEKKKQRKSLIIRSFSAIILVIATIIILYMLFVYSYANSAVAETIYTNYLPNVVVGVYD